MTKTIKRILLCPPDYFQIQYQINPWMANNLVDTAKAKTEWQSLVDLYQRLNIQVETISPQPDLPDMVFTVDQGLIRENLVLLANFRFSQRRPETEIYHQWFANQGLKVFRLPKNLYFEGGDALDLGQIIILGHGFRTKKQVAATITRIFQTPVIKLRLINPYFYHLDTCLFVPDSKTAFYYPPAFDQPSKEKLKSLFPRLISLEKVEAFNLAANSLVTNKQIITQQNNHIFNKQLTQLGYQVHQVNIGEFMKSGGGVHCLTTATKIN